MKTLITVLLTVGVLAGGCVTQEKAKADARAAYFAGQATALNQLLPRLKIIRVDSIQAGDKVKFKVEKRLGNYVVTELQMAK